MPSLRFALESKSMRGKKLLGRSDRSSSKEEVGGTNVPPHLKENALYGQK